MDINDACIKGVNTLVSNEVKRQMAKHKQQLQAAQEKVAASNTAVQNLKTELDDERRKAESQAARIENLENDVHKARATIDALENQLAAKTPKKKEKATASA